MGVAQLLPLLLAGLVGVGTLPRFLKEAPAANGELGKQVLGEGGVVCDYQTKPPITVRPSSSSELNFL
jgi:hypothetical protein